MNSTNIILGCGNFGGVGSSRDLIGQGESAAQAAALLDHAFEWGITRFDTANTYGGGQSERMLGQWLAKHSPTQRRQFSISTKVGNPQGCAAGDRPLSRQQILLHLDISLQRLQIEQLGVLYFHELDALTPIEESLQAVQTALQQGKVASFGLSNVSLVDVRRILQAAGPAMARQLTHVQNEFHYLHTQDSEELIPFLQDQHIHYVAFSPLAGGLLTGKYQFAGPPPAGSRLAFRPEPYARYLNPEGQRKILEFTAAPRASQRALRFVLDQPGVSAAIIGPRRVEHYADFGFERTKH
jgi:aryl-alcohol dehydrogenase-like predicted oxidoreductase